MAISGGTGRTPLSEINVTPLVDVMLVLLIIFMVAAPMLQTGISVDLPHTVAPRMDRQPEKLLLTVTHDRKVYLGEALVPFDTLQQSLSTNAKLKQDRELYIQADENVPYGFVAQVMAAVRAAGVEKLGLVTDPLASK